MLRNISRYLAVAVGLCLGAGSADATIIAVPGDQPTIQNGINAAQNGDTVLVAAGDYTENIDFGGKAIKVIGESGAAVTTLTPADPSAITILIIQGEGSGTEFSGFTVIGGAGPSVIQIESGAVPVIRNNVFRDYYSVMENAILIESHVSNPTIIQNLFVSNTGTIGCVGIMSGEGLITNNTFDSNMRGFWAQSQSVVARSNIVTNSIEFGIADVFDADYNCVYNNNPNYAVGAVPGANDIEADPLYCDPAVLDYSLDFASPCVGSGEGGIDRGAFGVGCGFTGPVVRGITVGEGDMQRVTDHTPLIAWLYDDAEDLPLVSSEIEVGSDENWVVAEMWQSPPIPGPDTVVAYAGLPLNDGSLYHIRIRVSNGSEWSDWRVQTFRMNSVPTAPAGEYPIGGESARSACARLVVVNSFDQETDPLTYGFELYDDAGLTGLVFSQTGAPEQTLQTASDTLPALLLGTMYWWRARAYDGFEYSDWSATEFFVSAGAVGFHVPGDYPSIQAAISATCDGDTVLVGPGSYVENIDFLGRAIKVIGEEGADVTFLAPADPDTWTVRMTKGEGPGTEFAGFTVTGGQARSVVEVYNGAAQYIHHNVFCDHYSLLSNSASIRSTSSGPTIAYNLFCNNTSSGCIGIVIGGGSILNNTFDGNQRGFWSNSGQGIAKNNVVTNSIEFGIGDEFTVLDYNCVYNNHPDYDNGAVPGPNAIVADPLYCDVPNRDYRVDFTSLCLGTGESGADRGAFGLGCGAPGTGPIVREIAVGETDLQHVIDHTPTIAWLYDDPDSKPLVSSEVEIGTDDDWSIAEMWQSPSIPTPDTSVVYAGLPLTDGQTYYIRVRAANDDTWSEWRERIFHMNAVPNRPEPTAPIDGSVVVTATPLMRLKDVVDADGDAVRCAFEIYTDEALTTLVASVADIAVSGTEASWTVDPPLVDENATHWWRARAFDGYEYSPWTQVETFALNLANDLPETATLLYPAHEAVVADLTPLFDWEDVIDPDPVDLVTYTFAIATDSLFAFKIEFPNLPFSFYQSQNLPYGQKYWWRVQATDKAGASTTSLSRSCVIPKPGDLNGDFVYNTLDAVLLVSIVFRGDPIPEDIYVVDVNADCEVSVLDVVMLVDLIFRGGPELPPPCGTAPSDRTRRVPEEYQTIQLAINAAVDLDSILVTPGSYSENIDFMGKTICVIGSNGAAATFLFPADPGRTTIAMTRGEGPGTEFAGFTVVGGAGTSVVQIEDGAAPRIRNNVFRNYHSTLQNAIVVESHGSDPTIAFNLFLENTGTIGCVGILSGSGHIENNTFDQNMRGFWSQSPSVIARNNIVTNSAEFGISDVFDSDYNCVYNNNPDYGVGASPAPHDISADPAYCDPAAEDHHLQPGSPCTGTGESGVTMGAFDVGCSPP